jgi:hypothetical protein
MKCLSRRLLVSVVAILFLAQSLGCNRALFRIPGVAGPFPPTPTGYTAKHLKAREVSVLLPTDLRGKHYGEKIAGTKWKACRTDALPGSAAPGIIQERVASELQKSGLFENVQTAGDTNAPLVLKTEIDAFGAQARGFILIPWMRIVGITSLRFILIDSGKVVFDEKIERVVTDADKEYTGSNVSGMGEAMHMAMSDSLRGVIEQLLRDLDEKAPTHDSK